MCFKPRVVPLPSGGEWMKVVLRVGLWMCNTVLERTFPSHEWVDLSSSCVQVEHGF